MPPQDANPTPSFGGFGLTQEDQARLGLPWVSTLVLANPGEITKGSFFLADWLIETRSAAAAVGLSARWQQAGYDDLPTALLIAGQRIP